MQAFARPGYGNIYNIVGSTTIVGASALKPQVVTSVESGGTVRWGPFAADLNAFFQAVDDRIEFERYGANFRAINAAGTTDVGLDTTVRFALGRVSAAATTSLQLAVTDGALSTLPRPSYPSIFGLVRCTVDLVEVHLQANAMLRWAGERGATQGNVLLNNLELYALESYASVDLSLSTQGIHLMDDVETVFRVDIKNLMDTRYDEPGYGGFDIPSQGRLVLLEARLLF